MATKYLALMPQQHQHRQWHHVFSFCLMFWVLVLCLLNPVVPEVIYRVDPLALLAATLRTYQRAGCDSEQLALSCPRGTSISIELAQYGRAGDLSDHSLCPPVSQEDLTTTSNAGDGVVHSGTEIEVKPPETCTVSGLQYALLQAVVDTCQKKRHCKFAASPKNLSSGDPCSGVRKFVEIAYKCRPYEFRSKVACENDNMPLVCNPYSRIAIYSASFGHVERESIQCGHGNIPDSSDTVQENGKQTCLVSYATETVMQICHGRRRCSITADAGTFGRPCKNDVRMYLKVVYTCIPRKVLKDRYETAPEADEPQQSELDLDQDELYDEDQFYKESEAIPPAPKLQGAIPNPAFPFEFNMGVDGPTTTLIPPLLSRNDSSLEDGLRLSAKIWPRKWPTDMFGPTTDFAQSEVYDDVLIPSADPVAPEAATEANATGNSPGTTVNAEVAWRNFLYRRRCRHDANGRVISTNCVETDIIRERVEVVGFVSNWMDAYVHIRKNQEQFYLYLIISVVAGVLLCLTLVIGRLALQRNRSSRKNSCSSGSTTAKNCNDAHSSDAAAGAGTGSGGGKFPPTATGEINLPNSFGDDISDIDADIDITIAMPLPTLPSRNETYMSYTPTSNCTYGSLQPQSSTSLSSATTVIMPSAHPGGLLMSTHNNQTVGPPIGGNLVGATESRHTTPSPAQLYTSMGICSPTVSGTMTMGSHVLAPSALNSVSQGSSYLTGTMMIPGHHHPHVGTLRRTYIPTSMGIMANPSSPTVGGNGGLHSVTGMPSTSAIYYDSTVPRNTTRGMSADNSQYYYG